MPKLIIDNQPIEVPEGTKVIEAAELLGIMIPRFCFHPALGAVGACRVCAVKFVDGPISGIEMSCMVNSKDGMVVSTTDPEAVDFRRHVIEWLMINHPHDCPVCDEGGHCLLQDMTVSGGHGIRRFQGKKRTHVDQHLGPLVQHEMNRCIQCYRCVRYYQEFTGYMDLGVMGIGSRVYFGRYKEGTLQSPFSGNLIDICPTGVFTDKPSRYTGRQWDFERTPGICIHCSLGCHTTVSARNRQIVRMEARFSHPVNGYFICDRGRYGFEYVNLSKRPRKGKIHGKETTPDAAIASAIEQLASVSDRFGPSAIAVIGSERSSLQTMAVLKHLCKVKNWQAPVFFNQRKTKRSVQTALSHLKPEVRASMREIEPADVILTVGADPLNEGPMAILSMRQAGRLNAKIFAVDPRPLKWPLAFEQMPCSPRDMAAVLREIRAGLVNTVAGKKQNSEGTFGIAALDSKTLTPIVDALQKSQRPALIGGTEITDADTVDELAELAETLQKMNKQAGLFYLLPHANSAGAAMLDEPDDTVSDILEKIESGAIKALVAVESDLWETFPDRSRLEKALGQLELLVCLDYLSTNLFEKAHIQIPVQTVFESGGIFVNQEGRAQKSIPAFSGGIPIAVIGAGNHPPRLFSKDIPGAEMRPAWRSLWRLTGTEAPQTDEALCRWMAKSFPALSAASGGIDDDGVYMDFSAIRRSKAQTDHTETEAGYELLPVASIFGDESMSRFSSCLQALENSPCLWMSADDAKDLGAASGDVVRLRLKTSPLELTVNVSRQIPPGLLVLPRHREIFWQQFDDPEKLRIAKDHIRIIKKA